MRVIIGIAGRRGSGKSTIAQRLAQEHDFVVTSFGNAVRREAVTRSVPTDTPTLQALGRRLIDEWGWERFCQAVLVGVADSAKIVIEGIRHRAAVAALQNVLSPEHFRLVFIQVPEEQRLKRLRLRGRVGDSHAGVESDPVEQEVDSLRELAEFVIDGEDPRAAERIAKWSSQMEA